MEVSDLATMQKARLRLLMEVDELLMEVDELLMEVDDNVCPDSYPTQSVCQSWVTVNFG
jgi:hypothetical protein